MPAEDMGSLRGRMPTSDRLDQTLEYGGRLRDLPSQPQSEYIYSTVFALALAGRDRTVIPVVVILDSFD